MMNIYNRYLAAKAEFEKNKFNKTFVILLIISYSILIAIIIPIAFARGGEEEGFEYIYYMSKILTTKGIIINNHRSELLDSFSNSGETTTLPMSYRNLLKLVKNKNECVAGYRPCGILDTYGNVLCVDEFIPCPINRLKITHVNAAEEYLSRNYKTVPLNNISTNYQFFYTNEFTQGNGVTMIIKTRNEPKFITLNNFVLDSEAYKEYFFDAGESLKEISNFFGEKTTGNEVLDIFINIFQTVADFVEEFSLINIVLKGAKLFADIILFFFDNDYDNERKKAFEKFVKEKIELLDEKNNDIYFEHIGDNFYAKNFIGFKKVEDIDKFLRFDFSFYKKKFPSLDDSELIALFHFIFLIFIVFLLLFFFLKKPDLTYFNWFTALFVSIIYLASSLLYFIHGIICYVNVNKNKTLDDLKSIESDDLIKVIINDFIYDCENNKLLIATLCIIPISMVFFLISMIQFYFTK